ncbi:helix-turn-helix transcriptional regulator [Hymenobacter sp. BRD67]|uniref:helix-turn-helix domain-containing protein n=1 Tax=Hymenobacter sp. BRD67 TaxID=2675877 RepID=UPI0015632B6E|nr:helix-turn-helix transcriptional regulator [Hymenobacter sp. BRD67]QKG52373.1 helix-turn-helix transcriptional regulator [Hymenobacter sp. BRD67]
MSAPASIGQRFTQLIQHLGLSKNAFAQSLDKTATVIQHLVDERNKPGYDLLCKVFETYPNVSKDWLLLGQGPMMSGQETLAPATPVVMPPIAGLFAAPVAEVPVVPVAPVVSPSAPPTVVAATPVPIERSEPLRASVQPAPALASAAAPSSPDANYLAVALQTQHLQHQLALAEQRNQHLLEQQALMQQLVAVLQRAV